MTWERNKRSRTPHHQCVFQKVYRGEITKNLFLPYEWRVWSEDHLTADEGKADSLADAKKAAERALRRLK